MSTKIITVEATPPSESTGADYNKGAPLNAAEFDQNLVNLRAAVDRKASLNNPTFTGTVTLPSTTSIGDVSATELQYLNSVTSNVQDQINAKAPINNPTFTGTVSLSGGTANGVLYLNGSKQVTSGSSLVFDSSGNLGIGTANPAQRLAVSAAASGDIMQLLTAAGGGQGWKFGIDTTNSLMYCKSNTSNYKYQWQDGVGTGLMTLDSSGNLTTTGDISNSSDTTIYSYKGGTAGTVRAGIQLIGTTPEIRFYLNGSNKATLDSSGNLGLGVTPSAWYSGYKAMQFPGGGSIEGHSGYISIWANSYLDSGAVSRYVNSDSASRYIQNSGYHIWYTAPSGTAGGVITWTEQMRLDTSGNLTITGSTATKASGTTWANPSDQRLKDNIRNYEKGLAELMQVMVREWEYNGKGGTTEGLKGLGVVADEIETILPNTVETYEAKLEEADEEVTTIKKFDATEITWLLVNAVKEQQAIIESLTQRIEALEYTKQGE